MPDQKTMRTSCLGGFSIMWVPKLLPTPIKIRIFGPKRPNFAQNYLFWPNIASFGTFGPMPDQETIQTRCVGGFSVTLVLKLLLPPERKRIFGPKLAFLVDMGQALPAHLVSGSGARALSRKTPIYFIHP